ncbi:single-stranded DNA-binding protein [Mycoplasma parvum]|uniref:Single-stranded DNA-binding protein n=1 Tax=Mycoplasma parvum str. Indiana TaxID=1403316 RepID=U5NB59_9MOLU|nr:single-stranded DNA-binding protein [Mycoplasma parvum]AGX88811.1 hypothetical protein PRV_00105 [Mycoplasma parvum str. Indiana]
MLPRGYLIGNFTSDPVPGITNSSLDYSRFSVACSENYTRINQSAKTHFFQCIAWGKRAQYISTYLKKGDSVFIEFTLYTNNYTNMEGRVVKRIDLQVEKIEMLYQKLHRNFDSGTISTDSNLEDKDLLHNQSKQIITSAETCKSNEEIELDLSEIYKSSESSST